MTKNDKSIQAQNQSDNTDSSSESEVKINNESESRTNGTVIEEHRTSVADNKGNASKETATERPLNSYQPLNPNDF